MNSNHFKKDIFKKKLNGHWEVLLKYAYCQGMYDYEGMDKSATGADIDKNFEAFLVRLDADMKKND